MNQPHPSSSVQVSIIVVAADSGPLLRECVHHALASATTFELILLDNASSDGVPQAIDRAYTEDTRVRVVYNHANLGFGPAVNRGAALASGRALLILNPDCLLDPDTLPRMLSLLDTQPHAGLIGAVVCDSEGRPDPASRRRDPLFRRAINTMTGRALREAKDSRYEGVNIPGPLPEGPEQVEAVSGALMLLPRIVFEKLKGFDENYFLHCEDLDLCRRARDLGYRVLLAGDIHVLHGKGGSSRHRPVFVSRHKHRGMWRWFRKFDPAARNPLLAGIVWLGIWTHFVLKIPGQLLRLGLRKMTSSRNAGA
jgi:N-acetylglucosaminyl-diphospho-decaprenol L-rhamnosyltransferase